MSNVVANPGVGGATFATDTIAGVDFPKNKLGYGADGAFTDVSTVNGLPVQQSGTWTVASITNPVAVTGTFFQVTQPVSIAATVVTSNANLDVALSTRLKAADTLAGVTALGSITNALPSGTNVIGHVIADSGSTTAVTGNVAVTNAGLTNLDVALSTRTKPADQQHTILDSGVLTSITNSVAVTGTFFPGTQPVSAVSLPLPANAAQETGGNLAALYALLNLAQGATSTTLTGPMVQALVSDGPESYLDNTVRPLSITNEGRLRVSTVAAMLDQEFFPDELPDCIGSASFNPSPW